MSRQPATPPSWLVIAIAHLAAGLFLLSPSYIRPDSVAVYSYLRSLTFDLDFLFLNEWAGFGMVRDQITLWKEVTPAGTLANHWWVGTAILSSPFYLLAHAAARVFPSPLLGSDGFFGLYATTLAWSTVLFGIVASILGYTFALRLTASRFRAALSLAFICLGTPWFFYEFRLPLGTHLAGAMLIGTICWLLFPVRGSAFRTSGAQDETGTRNEFLLGLAIGLAVVTRLQHVTLLPAIAILLISRRSPLSTYTRIAAGAILPILIQAAAWAAIYGNPLGPLGSGANLTGSTWLPFHHNHLGAVLFSSYHGLFVWSPIVLAAIAGWVLEIRGEHRTMTITLLLMFAGEWIANGTLDRYFWGGFSFGPRRFVDLAVPFVIGLAWLMRRFPAPVLVFSTLATLWSVLLSHAAIRGTLDLAHDISPAALLSSVRAAFRAPAAALYSPVTDLPLLIQSALAMLLMGFLVWLMFRIVRAGWHTRALVAFLGIWLGFSLLAIGSTRTKAPAESARLGIDPARAARFGPLADQRTLLLEERAFYERKKDVRSAQKTSEEIQAIDDVLRALH